MAAATPAGPPPHTTTSASRNTGISRAGSIITFPDEYTLDETPATYSTATINAGPGWVDYDGTGGNPASYETADVASPTFAGNNSDKTIIITFGDYTYIGESAEIRIEIPDTDTTPNAKPTHGSRGLMLGGTAAADAAIKLRERMVKVAADMLSCSEQNVELKNGKAFKRDDFSKKINIPEIAEEIYIRGISPAGARRCARLASP